MAENYKSHGKTGTFAGGYSAYMPGEWTESLDDARAYGKAANRFVLVDWGKSSGCTNCDAAKNNVFSKTKFKNWAKRNSIPLCFVDDLEQSHSQYSDWIYEVYYNSAGADFPQLLLLDPSNETDISPIHAEGGTKKPRCVLKLWYLGGCGYASSGGYDAVQYIAQTKMEDCPNATYSYLTPDSLVDNLAWMLSWINSTCENALKVKLGVKNGCFNDYGVRKLGCRNYWIGNAQVEKIDLKCHASSQFHWFRLDCQAGKTYEVVVQDYVDPEECGKCLVFAAAPSAEVKTYDDALAQCDAEFGMGDDIVFTAESSLAYLLFTRKDDVREEFKTSQGKTVSGYHEFDVDYTFTVKETAEKSVQVTFEDHDGTVLKTQLVTVGGSATPPPDPARQDYVFTGWKPGYVAVTSDTVCVAQYEPVRGYWLSHTYSTGQHTLSVSNNLSAIQAVGDMAVNGMKSQLTSVGLCDKMFELMPSCFINCGQLKAVEVDKSTRWIGDCAFADCSGLAYVNALAYPKQTMVNVIGRHAFAGTGLVDVAIDLSGTAYDTGIGEYAFARCANLRSVRLTRSSYLGRNAFDSCSALTSVTLPDYTSFVYPETFRNCTALAEMTLPRKIWMLSEGMFSGCSSLSSVTIEDKAERRSILDRVGPRVFENCPKLTKITLPASISSLEQIDSAFLSGSSISSIRFDGLPDGVFQTDYTETKTTKLTGYVTTLPQFNDIAQDALDGNIPIVMITLSTSLGVDYNSGCPNCRGMAGQLSLPSWDAYMQKHAKEYYFVLATYRDQLDLWNAITRPKANGSPMSAAYSDTFASNLYAKGVVVYKAESGEIYKKKLLYTRDRNAAPTEGLLIGDIESALSAYSGGGGTSGQTETVTKISKFGSPLDRVTAYSMSGKEYTLSSDSVVEKYKAPEPDTVTVSDFKTGVWYYNARQLKDYADANHMPTFVEFSDTGCTPCARFRETIYERKEFQDWVSRQKYLFCRIEVDDNEEFRTLFTQANFAYDTWSRGTRPLIPGLIFYWNKGDGDVTWNISSYHSNQVDYIGLENMISSNLSA